MTLYISSLIKALDILAFLLPKLCFVIVLSYLLLHSKTLKYSNQHTTFLDIKLGVIFGVFSIISTHSGIIADIDNKETIIPIQTSLPILLHGTQSIISFRDAFVMSSGLLGGPIGGFISGSLAGAERFMLGGDFGDAAGLSTVIVGLLSGLSRNFILKLPKRSMPYYFSISSFIASLIQRVIFLIFASSKMPISVAWDESLLVGFYLIGMNLVGCFIFGFIKEDWEKSNTEETESKAELQILQTMIQPHTLKSILLLIIKKIDSSPEAAKHSLSKLRDFFSFSHTLSKNNLITLKQELDQIHRYMDIVNLITNPTPSITIYQNQEIEDIMVLNCSILIFIENAYVHAFSNKQPPFELKVIVIDGIDNIKIQVIDNGLGVSSKLSNVLGKEPVSSSSILGSGSALYNLGRRERLTFGQSTLKISNINNSGTVASIKFPKKR